jgi:DNA-binding NarL/FixJ family response regulator
MGPETRTATVRLLLLDRDVLFRESLGSLLDAEPELRVTSQCAAAHEAVERLEQCPVDVLLLAWDGLDDGCDALAALRKAAPQAAILIIAAKIGGGAARRALRLGVSGIFLKHNPAHKLVAAVRMIAQGDAWMDRDLLGLLAGETGDGVVSPFHALTERERKVLEAVMEGLTNREIGALVGASEPAVKRTLRSLFEKTGTRSRAALVRTALDTSFGMREGAT